MAALQLTFTLRTSPNCKTVHLIGNWDGYKSQLPLSKDASKAGAWKGTFRFQGSTLKTGQRYWYYYIMDGYHVSHDPAKPFTTEPTTGRNLNILDVPSDSRKPTLSVNTTVKSTHERRSSKHIAQGRSLSPSRIISPKPQKPSSAVEKITAGLGSLQFQGEEDSDSETDFSDSDCDSDVPSLTSSRSSACSSPRTPSSPVSSRSSSRGSACFCQRFGITRSGERVKIDCKGSRCGGSDESDSSCDDSEDERVYTKARGQTRRQGVVIQRRRV